MDAYSEIERRFGFNLPEEFKILGRAGILDHEHPDYLRLTDVRWHYPPHVAGQDIPKDFKAGIVPFASSPKGDCLSWVLGWKTDVGIGTAFCLRGSSMARGYAPSFAGAVYRALLEEFADSLLDESVVRLQGIFRSYVDCVAPVMREPWLNTLNELAGREPQLGDDGAHVLDESELQQLIIRDLQFPHLNAPMKYMC